MLACGLKEWMVVERGVVDVVRGCWERREVLDGMCDVGALKGLEGELGKLGVAGREEFERVWGRVEKGEGQPGFWREWAKRRMKELKELEDGVKEMRDEEQMENRGQSSSGLKDAEDADKLDVG